MSEISQTIPNFKRSLALFDEVVAQVPSDAWGNATPCSEWDATELVRHQCGVLDALAEVARTEQVVRPEMAGETGDPAGMWTATRDGLLSALEGADLNREDAYWFGPMSFGQFVGMVQWDPLTHAWDLGRATGVAVELPEDLCEISLAMVKGMGEIPRKWRLIADEVPVAEDAPVADQFLAYIGRQP